MIEIVEGDASHIAAMMPIMTDAFDPVFGEAWTSAQCLSALAQPGCQMLLAKKNDDLCGFALSRWVLDTEELLMIGVPQHHRRQRIGTQLLRRIVQTARSQKRNTLFLEVRDGNSAYLFYEDMGFRPVGRRKLYYKGLDGRSSDAITMALSLTDLPTSEA